MPLMGQYGKKSEMHKNKWLNYVFNIFEIFAKLCFINMSKQSFNLKNALSSNFLDKHEQTKL